MDQHPQSNVFRPPAKDVFWRSWLCQINRLSAQKCKGLNPLRPHGSDHKSFIKHVKSMTLIHNHIC